MEGDIFRIDRALFRRGFAAELDGVMSFERDPALCFDQADDLPGLSVPCAVSQTDPQRRQCGSCFSRQPGICAHGSSGKLLLDTRINDVSRSYDVSFFLKPECHPGGRSPPHEEEW